MKNLVPENLLRKYLQGKCTPDELTIVHKWYNSFNDETDLVSSLPASEQMELKQRLLAGIRSRILTEDFKEDTQIGNSVSKKRTNFLPYFSAAAALILVVLGFTFFNRLLPKQVKKAVSENVSVTNLTALIQKQTLSDSTIVWLSPQSNITYPKTFTGDLREVKMSGEAFFDVKHDRKRPFIIYGGGVMTQVLGTSFRIKAYKNRPTEVSVITGKVAVIIQKERKEEVFLLPTQRAIYSQSNDVLTKGPEQETSLMQIWKKTSISFDNTPMTEVINSLNKQFKINLHSTDPQVFKYTLNADFTDQSLPSILDMLGKSLNVTYEINQESILLKTKN